MTRIAPGTRKVSWIETAEIAIGHHSCEWCDAETPAPSDGTIADFIRSRDGIHSTLWPHQDDGWRPPGWTWHDGSLLCPDCTRERDRALARARSARKNSL